MYNCYIQSFKILASFCSWAGWFECYQVKNARRHIFAWCGSFDMTCSCLFYPCKRMSPFEPPHDQPTKWHVRPAKISPGIRPVCSESSLCIQWVAQDPMFLHADSDDSDQIGPMPRLIWVFIGHTCHFVGFIMRWFICQLWSVRLILIFIIYNYSLTAISQDYSILFFKNTKSLKHWKPFYLLVFIIKAFITFTEYNGRVM